ncbi:SRPBCC family protein [Streptomyces violaceusniger]|uniref:SRPBCC family protein n=1 Tax=Streptomyces violaceusniger TaxID=68280 RepID=UPI003811772F
MAHAYWSSVFAGPADKLWSLVRRFNGLPGWHLDIRSSEVVEGESEFAPGAIRVLTGTDGSVFRERLVALDDANRALTYEIIDSPLPVRGYRSTLQVWPVADTGGAFLTWQSTFDAAEGTSPEAAVAAITDGAYRPAIAALHKTVA